jgi:hypothetical protein
MAPFFNPHDRWTFTAQTEQRSVMVLLAPSQPGVDEQPAESKHPNMYNDND